MNELYVWERINRYNSAKSEISKNDLLWRIASNADLLDDLPDNFMDLTESQKKKVVQFIKNFKYEPPVITENDTMDLELD